MSDSVRPHRRQPTRLPRPWDSPGKNTGVGCHFLLQCMKVKVKCSVLSDSLRPHGLQPTRFLCPWDFPGKSTGVGCYCLLHITPKTFGISKVIYLFKIFIYFYFCLCWVFVVCVGFSLVVAHELSRCSSRPLEHRLNSWGTWV